MIIVTIALGVLGLGVVVFVHELGHFLAARLVGVEVEEFSLGWGPRVLSKKIGGTAYSLSAFPIGGYCRMKGEESYRKAIEEGLDEIPRDAGTYFGAPPLKRILIAFGGPFMNVAFAFAVYCAVMAVGYDVKSWDNRVILASEYDGKLYPADAVGIESGDRLVSINGKAVTTFSEIQEAVALSAKLSTDLVVDREGRPVNLAIKPELDKGSGAGRVGVYPWIEPIVATVSQSGPAMLAGLRAGDRIISVDGLPVKHTLAINQGIEKAKPQRAVIGFTRGGAELSATLILSYDSKGIADLGIGWAMVTRTVRASGPLDALAMGFYETGKTIQATYRGIASLFMGVDLLKAVSGPARITWMVGTVASSGLSGESAGGMSMSLNFLAALSIGLFAMNLLPIPLLDGGSILLFIVEILRRKAIKVKTIFRYQTIGMVAVAAIFILSTVGDVIFFSGR